MTDMHENKVDFGGINLSVGVNTFKTSSFENFSSEVIQNKLRCRLNVINRLCEDTCVGGGKSDSSLPLTSRFFGGIVHEKISLDLFVKFGKICEELITRVKEPEITRDTSEFFWKSICKQKRFFHCSYNDPSQITKFLNMQANIQAFTEVREVIMERPPEITCFHAGDKRQKLETRQVM